MFDNCTSWNLYVNLKYSVELEVILPIGSMLMLAKFISNGKLSLVLEHIEISIQTYGLLSFFFFWLQIAKFDKHERTLLFYLESLLPCQSSEMLSNCISLLGVNFVSLWQTTLTDIFKRLMHSRNCGMFIKTIWFVCHNGVY